MSSISIFNSICNTCFPKAPNLAELVHQYSYDKNVLPFLVDQVVQRQSVATNLLVVFLTDNLRQIEGFKNCKIENADTVKKVCVYILSTPCAFKKKPDFLGAGFSCTARKVLVLLKTAAPDKGGNLFELKPIFAFHETRAPRKTEGEKDDNKFIVDLATNKFFCSANAANLIYTAVSLGLAIPQLHKEFLAPPAQTPSKDTTGSLREHYQQAQALHLAQITGVSK